MVELGVAVHRARAEPFDVVVAAVRDVPLGEVTEHAPVAVDADLVRLVGLVDVEVEPRHGRGGGGGHFFLALEWDVDDGGGGDLDRLVGRLEGGGHLRELEGGVGEGGHADRRRRPDVPLREVDPFQLPETFVRRVVGTPYQFDFDVGQVDRVVAAARRHG